MNEKSNLIKTYVGTSNTWYLFLRTLYILDHIEDADNFDQTAINATKLQNAAASVEGAIKSLLINHIQNKEFFQRASKEGNVELKSFLDNSIIEILKFSWSGLKDYFKKQEGLDLQTLRSDKGIHYLFDFRNTLAHGGIIQHRINFKNEGDIEKYRFEFHSKKNLINYLKEKKLIGSDHLKYVTKWELLNTDVTNHFINLAVEFIGKVYSEYLEKHEANFQIKNDYEVYLKTCGKSASIKNKKRHRTSHED